MLRVLHMLGRALGALCGFALAAGWSYALWVPAAGVALADKSVVGGVSVVFVSLLMIALALFGALGSWRGHPTVVMLVFIASFFPLGLSLLPSADWVHWLGYLDVGLLIAAALIWSTARASKQPLEAVE